MDIDTGLADERAVASLARMIMDADRILVFTGAGISTRSGIPDYRGPKGVWNTRRPVFYDEFMPCVEVAEELNVWLLIEPEPGLMIETFEQYLEFVDRVDSLRVGLNFDVGHAF